MSEINVPGDLRYTQDHEWARPAGKELTIGITAFAVEQLGDITLVNFDVKVGDAVTVGKAFGTIESVKTLSDLFAPVTGKIVKINAALETKPELVNEDCYGKGWMVVIEAEEAVHASALLDPSAYSSFLTAAAH